MVNRYLLTAVACFLLFACNNNRRSTALDASSLQTQLVTVDVTRDNIFRTVHGAIIQIPKGALQAKGNSPIKLEIKEAYSITDIVKGGLLTQGDGKLLSSGGMIYINAADESEVRIVKPISVAIPSRSLDDESRCTTCAGAAFYRSRAIRSIANSHLLYWRRIRPCLIDERMGRRIRRQSTEDRALDSSPERSPGVIQKRAAICEVSTS